MNLIFNRIIYFYLIFSNSLISLVLALVLKSRHIGKLTLNIYNIVIFLFVFLFLLINLLRIDNFGNLVELKVLAIISLLSFFSIMDYRFVPNRFNSNLLIVSVISYFVLAAPLAYPYVLRFPDTTRFPLRIISIYYGVICIFAFYIARTPRQKLLTGVLAILSGSGTAMLGLFPILFSNKRLHSILAALCSLAVILPVFYIAQVQRGRDVFDWSTIDRIVITVSAFKYLYYETNIFQWIVGLGPTATLPQSFYSLVSEVSPGISSYLLAEGNGHGSGRNLHNDHLRIVFHFGLIGYLIFWASVKQLMRDNFPLFLSIYIMSFLNSILTISAVLFVFLIFIKRVKV